MINNPFKVGDQVECISNGGYTDRLTIGEFYLVETIDGNCIWFFDDNGARSGAFASRFKLVEEQNMKKYPVYLPGQVVKIVKTIKFCNGSYFSPGDKIDVTELNAAYFNHSGKQDCYELVKPEIPVVVGQKYQHKSGNIFIVANCNPCQFVLIDVNSGDRYYNSSNDLKDIFANNKEFFTLMK